jgi:hypothetical protein
MSTDLRIGDRVQLSELGRKGAKQPDRIGVVLAISRSGTQCTIMWDGVRAAQVFYFTLVERAPNETGKSAGNECGSAS